MKYGWNIENELTFGELSRDFYYANLLVDNIMGENMPEVRSLLETKKANPNTVMPELGVAPLHLLAGLENEDFSASVTLQAILRNGGDPNVRSEDGLTPVHVAAMWGRCKVLDILLANGGDPELIDYKMFLNAEEYAIKEQQWKAYGVLSTFSVMAEGGYQMDGQNESIMHKSEESSVQPNSEKELKIKHLLKLKDKMNGQNETNLNNNERTNELPNSDKEFKNKYLLKMKDNATNYSDSSSVRGGENSCRYSTVRKKKKNKRYCQSDDETRSDQSDWLKSTIKLSTPNMASSAIKIQSSARKSKKPSTNNKVDDSLTDRSDRSKSLVKPMNYYKASRSIKRQSSAKDGQKITQNNELDDSQLTDRSDRSKSTIKSMTLKATSAIKRQCSAKKECVKKCMKKNRTHNGSLMSDRSDLSRNTVEPLNIKEGEQSTINRQSIKKEREKINKNVQTMNELNSDQSDWSRSTGTIQSLKLNDGALNTINRQRRKTNIYESLGTTSDQNSPRNRFARKEAKKKISKLSLYGDNVSESCDWIRKSVSSIKLDETALSAIKSRRLSSKIYQTKGLGEDALKERAKEPPIYEESEVCDWVDPRNYETFDESSRNKINIHRTRTATYNSEDIERPPMKHSGPKLPKRNRRIHHKKKEDSAMYLCGYTEESLRTGDRNQLRYLPSGLSDVNSSDFDERGIPNQRMLCKMSRIFLFMLKKRHIYQKIK